jgi:hypothetical protein
MASDSGRPRASLKVSEIHAVLDESQLPTESNVVVRLKYVEKEPNAPRRGTA